MISNLENGLREDGANIEIKDAERQYSLALWRRRRCEVIRTTVNLCIANKVIDRKNPHRNQPVLTV
jgi:hypothetical protein